MRDPFRGELAYLSCLAVAKAVGAIFVDSRVSES